MPTASTRKEVSRANVGRDSLIRTLTTPSRQAVSAIRAREANATIEANVKSKMAGKHASKYRYYQFTTPKSRRDSMTQPFLFHLSCQGNYKGSACELDGEVLGVAIGASVAAVIIIVLTLVLLCMWSRRWRQNQEKMVDRSAYMEQLKTMPFPGMMHDRIRWAQYAEAMASAHNLYAVSGS